MWRWEVSQSLFKIPTDNAKCHCGFSSPLNNWIKTFFPFLRVEKCVEEKKKSRAQQCVCTSRTHTHSPLARVIWGYYYEHLSLTCEGQIGLFISSSVSTPSLCQVFCLNFHGSMFNSKHTLACWQISGKKKISYINPKNVCNMSFILLTILPRNDRWQTNDLWPS